MMRIEVMQAGAAGRPAPAHASGQWCRVFVVVGLIAPVAGAVRRADAIEGGCGLQFCPAKLTIALRSRRQQVLGKGGRRGGWA